MKKGGYLKSLAKNSKKFSITTLLIIFTCFTLGTSAYAQQESNEPEIKSINQKWDLYTNHKYGFSLKIPKKMYHGYGSMCTWDGQSYRPKGDLVPVKVFEEGDQTYISSDYFYILTGETVKNDYYYYSDCEKVDNTIKNIKNKDYWQQLDWELISANVSNDTELEAFIKKNYGSGCQLGRKNDSIQSGVYDIAIKGDGKAFNRSTCPLNFQYILKYDPAKNKAVTWKLDQASTFSGDFLYDKTMIDSFRFE